MLGLIRKYPLTAFFTIAIAISWLLWLPRVAAQYGWIGPVSPYWHFVGSLGPMLGALIVAGVIYGQGGLERLWQGMIKWRVSLGWWGIAVLGPVVVMLLAIVIIRLMGNPWPEWRLLGKVAEFPQLGFIALLIAETIFYGYGEEVGWRGFALPYLQRRYSALWSSVLLSMVWFLWHTPLFITNESYRQMNLLMFLGFYFSILTGAILLTWLYNGTKGSLLLLALFHALLDVTMINEALNLQAVNLMGMLITFWGLAAIWLVIKQVKVIWDIKPTLIKSERESDLHVHG